MPAGSTYSTIATTTLGSAAADITFTGISSSFTDLVLIVTGRFDSANVSRELRIQVGNGSIDTGSNYSYTRMVGLGSSTFSDRFSNQTNMSAGVIPAANAAAGIIGNAIYHFQNYSNTTTNKTVINRTNDPNDWVTAMAGLWRSTSVINQIKIFGLTANLIAGSTATLYGITAA